MCEVIRFSICIIVALVNVMHLGDLGIRAGWHDCTWLPSPSTDDTIPTRGKDIGSHIMYFDLIRQSIPPESPIEERISELGPKDSLVYI
jgi:hypothetical protein